MDLVVVKLITKIIVDSSIYCDDKYLDQKQTVQYKFNILRTLVPKVHFNLLVI